MGLINRKSKVFKIISIIIIVVITAIITRVFIDKWDEIPFEKLSLNYPLLILAILTTLVISAASAWLWKYTLHILGDKTRFFEIWRITVYSQIARYLPGKVWQYMGKVYWGKKIGLSSKNILLSTFLETIFLMSGGFIISLFSLPLFLKKNFLSIEFILLVLLLLIITLCSLHPRILSGVINILGKKWLKNKVSFHFSYIQIFFLLILYTLLWLSIGFQLYLFTISFYPLQFSHFIYLTSFNALSWLIGFLSIITPSGLGVKEGVFILGLKMLLPVSFAIICVVLIRLYAIAYDILITAVFFLLDKSAWQNLIEFRKSSSELQIETDDVKLD